MKCYETDCTNPSVDTVQRWTGPAGAGKNLEEVPVCGGHLLCPTCGDKMEVNPITDEVCCFLHPTHHIKPLAPQERTS